MRPRAAEYIRQQIEEAHEQKVRLDGRIEGLLQALQAVDRDEIAYRNDMPAMTERKA